MITNHITFAQFCSAVRRKGALALCLVLCTLGPGLSTSAQEPQITTFDAPGAGTIANDYNGTFSTGINLLGTVARVAEISGTQTTTNIPNNFDSRQRGYRIGPAVPRQIKPAAGTAAPALNTKEVVLHNFASPPHGAYPAAGVVRDSAGNLYGTTNGAYSDVPGGGAHNAGVVFKVDTFGNETVLYSFTGGADGSSPNTVIRDSKGNLYGTTNYGGASGVGVVFKVDTSGHETVLYTFTGGNDGAYPNPNVTLDSVGNFYGTTNNGGTAGLGVVFKVDTSGNETVLHTFTRGLEGDQPDLAGVILDSVGNLYGTAAFGGAGGQGVVYKLDTSGNETVLYAFPGAADGQYPYNAGVIFGSDCHLYGTTFYGGKKGHGVVYQLDGDGNEKVLYNFHLLTANGFGQPTGGVIRDSKGNLYGTTFIGQADVGYGNGVVYKVDTAGHSTVLHNFTGEADGGVPYGGVIRDSKGNLYGTAEVGGASGAGVVFKVDTFGNETVLYSFTGGSDGGYPLWVVLVRDSAGNLYGTTNGGGASGAGVVFKVNAAGNETVLHSFTGGADGGNPYAGVILGPEGNLYGTTAFGGETNAGVVFEIKP